MFPTGPDCRSRWRRRVLAFSATIYCLLYLVGCGRNGGPTSPTAAPDPQLSPEEAAQVAEGKRLFSRHCASCHAVEPETVIVGPSLAGIAGRAATRVDGLTAEEYIEISILQPGAYLVEGFDDVMPANLGKRLTGDELDALVAYLLTLE